MAKRKQFNKPKGPAHNINNRIRAKEVMLVGDNVERDVYTISEAIRIADNLNLDLVEISPNQNPPICKVIDYQKFLYDQKKNKKQPDKVVMKEIRFKAFIDDNDFERKTNQAIDFLKKGYKVKLDCLFMGRAMEEKKDRILKLTYTLLDNVTEHGIPEQMPKIQGKKMVCIIKPTKKKSNG